VPIPKDILLLIDELERLRTSRDDAWQVPRIEGELLYHIALATGAKRVLEVGTSYGFSGLFWGAALRHAGGRLQTVDIDPHKVDSSKATFARAGLTSVIENIQGDARDVLPKVAGSFDIVFLDAGEKRLTKSYFEIVWPKVRNGGSVLTDNATTHRSELADFVKHVRSRPDATSTEIPVGNGLEWTVKTSD